MRQVNGLSPFLLERNHTENIAITLDFLTGSLCWEEEDWKG